MFGSLRKMYVMLSTLAILLKQIRTLDSEEKLTLPMVRLGQIRLISLVNESGLYALIFESRNPSAQEFRKWITKEVIFQIKQKRFYGKIDWIQLAIFIEMYKDNFHKISKDHFFIICEMFVRMYIELKKVGHQIPDTAISRKQIMPDFSVGRRFSKYLLTAILYITEQEKIHSFISRWKRGWSLYVPYRCFSWLFKIHKQTVDFWKRR